MTRPLRRAFWSLALLLASPLVAQETPVASAAQGRVYWRNAGAAFERGDTLASLAALDSAWHAWPGQSAYPRASARMAGRLGLLDRALPGLEALTTMGASWDAADPVFVRFTADPRFRAAADRNRAATAPLERSRIRWAVGVDSLLPEGVAFDSATGRRFLSSLRSKKILVRGPEGQVRDFIPSGAGGVGCVLGMAIDGGRLVGIQNGIAPVRVIRIQLDSAGRAVTGVEVLDRPPLEPGEATLATRVGGELLFVATFPARVRGLPLPR